MLKKLIPLLLIFTIACKVQFVPSADATIKAEVTQAAQETDALYLEIINSNNKSFTTYAAKYAAIESEINTITAQDAARPHGAVLTKQMGYLHDVFITCENQHKTLGILNVGQATINKAQLAAAWLPINQIENHYK